VGQRFDAVYFLNLNHLFAIFGMGVVVWFSYIENTTTNGIAGNFMKTMRLKPQSSEYGTY